MKVLKIGFLLLVIALCSCDNQRHRVVNTPATKEHLQTQIIGEFTSWNRRSFNKKDSCAFIGYVKEYFPKDSIGSPRIIGNLKTYNFICPFTYFDFSILKKDSSAKYYFYGQFEVHRLKFDYQFPEGKLLVVENPSINKLLNELLVAGDRPPSQFYQEVKEQIVNLYYTRFKDYKNLSYPTFREVMSTLGYHEDFDSEENRKIIRNDLAVTSDHLLVLRDDYVGILIFKINIDGGRIVVNEYMLKPKDRIKYFKNDNLPEFDWCH